MRPLAVPVPDCHDAAMAAFGDSICPACGTPRQPAEMLCSSCGATFIGVRTAGQQWALLRTIALMIGILVALIVIVRAIPQ